MSAFNGRHDATKTTRLDPEGAIATLMDLDVQIACRPEIESSQVVGEGRLALVLQAMSHGPVDFQGRYTLALTRDGETVRWRSADGNMEISGSARFSPGPGGGARIAYSEAVSVDMGLGRMMARVARPIAERMMARGMEGFFERVIEEMDRRA